MSKPITIPVRKHTRVHRPMSRWVVSTGKYDDWYKNRCLVAELRGVKIVTDISKGLENPIQFFDTEIVRQQKGDWNDKDMGGTPLTVSNMSGFTPGESVTILHEGEYKHGIISELPKEKRKTKPSLLTKLKNRFKK